MKKFKAEAVVGVFVLTGIFALGYISIQFGDLDLFGTNTYTLYADFDNVTGVREGAAVEIAGVSVGRVEKITVHRDMARLALSIRKNIQLCDDTYVSIKTRGLIGEKLLKLDPGGSGELLKPGDFITETESSVDLEELIGKYGLGGV